MFRLKTFGGLSLDTGPIHPGGRGAQRRRLALLARLAAARGLPVSRDKLLALLWPERDTGAARHALAQAVYEIRRTLGEGAVTAGPADDLRLDPARVASDVGEFHDALGCGDLERAVSVYAGPFLDGFYVDGAPEFERWAEAERDRLARACAGALETIARDATAAGESDRAVHAWRHLRVLRPLDPSVALSTMHALIAAGNQPGALAEASRHAATLHTELELPADPAVSALAADLRRQAAPAAPPPRAAAARAAPTVRPMAAAVVGAIVLIGGLGAVVRLTRADDSPRSVVLGSVRSNDESLGLAIREAIRTELDASSSVRVLTDAGLQETLRLMALSDDTAVSGDLAVEIAQRRGIPLAVIGSVMTMGDGAALTVQVIEAGTGRVVSTASAHPANADEVLDAVVRVARNIRDRVAGARVDTVPPLPAVTTTSLTALQQYVMAREALKRNHRARAIDLAEGAVVHDSVFALAHFLLGDLLWFADRQERSVYHLTTARRLSDRLPPRERLIVQARYEQLVADRPDSALTTWRLLRNAYPDDPLAPEGMSWAYRALGHFREAIAAADTAVMLDATALAPNLSNRIHALLALGDTTAARATLTQAPHWRTAVELFAALMRRDYAGAETVLRQAPPGESDPVQGVMPYWQQTIELARGHLPEAERAMSAMVARNLQQYPPRVLLSQARAEIAFGGSAEHAAALAREAFSWMRNADLSPPAYARTAERIADVAARTGDLETLHAVEAFIRHEDAGRSFRTYRLALETIAVCRAFAARDFARAADLAHRTRQTTYFWRTTSILTLLEADARAALGDPATARELYRSLQSWPIPYDGDYEVWPLLRTVAERALE